jgi:phosphatidylglycerophosphate synthase
VHFGPEYIARATFMPAMARPLTDPAVQPTVVAMVPWILTLGRLPLAGAFAIAVAVSARAGGPLTGGQRIALLLLALAAECTDMLDGWAARRTGRQSQLGGLADPLCDSLARLTMYFALALAGWVWIGVPLLMAGRDLVVAYIRVVLGITGGKTSARGSGKAKAIVQGFGILLLVMLAGPAAPGRGGPALWRWGIAAAVLLVTAWSLADYLRAGWCAAKQMARRDR